MYPIKTKKESLGTMLKTFQLFSTKCTRISIPVVLSSPTQAMILLEPAYSKKHPETELHIQKHPETEFELMRDKIQ
jgi:hypothetical protein